MANDTADRGRERAQHGQSLTELPIALVLFLVLTFGIVDAGRLIYAYNVVSLSAREGVRWAAVRGGTSGRTASKADIQDFVQSKTVGVPQSVETVPGRPTSLYGRDFAPHSRTAPSRRHGPCTLRNASRDKASATRQEWPRKGSEYDGPST